MFGPKGLRSLTTTEDAVGGHILYTLTTLSIATYNTATMGRGRLGAEISNVARLVGATSKLTSQSTCASTFHSLHRLK